MKPPGILRCGWVIGRPAGALYLVASLAILPTAAQSADNSPKPATLALAAGEKGSRISPPAHAIDPPEHTAPVIEWSQTEVRTDSPAVVGSKLVLEIGQGSPRGARFRWIQIEGPALEIADPDCASIVITIPAGTDRLSFLLVASTQRSVRVVRVNVPVQGGATEPSAGPRHRRSIKADAGDDQVGLVGHRVTLNGSRSRPSEVGKARWLQVEGPAVNTPQQIGSFYSFVPTAPGLYRFWLIVAGEGEISEPDEVVIMVGSPPAVPPARNAASSPPPAAFPAPAAVMDTPERLLIAALSRLPNSARVCSDVSDVMESISERTALYESFAMLQAELTRRLDVVIPTDPALRNAWTELVFAPLTTFTANQMLAAGIDFRMQQALAQPLSPAQKERVQEHFQGLARAFRVVAAAR